MKRWTVEDLRELAPGYVMDILEPEERAAFEGALGSSPELEREVGMHREAALALATERNLPPPPALRDILMLRIAAERGLDRSTLRARGNGGRMRYAAVALGLALAASLAFVAVLQRRVTSLDDQLHVRDVQINTILGDPKDLAVLNFTGEPGAGMRPPGLQFFWNLRQGRGMLHAFRIASAREGSTYQLWLVKNGTPVPSAVFNTDAQGHVLLAGIEMPRQLAEVSALMVTLEPVGGSPRPTGKPLIVGQVRRGE